MTTRAPNRRWLATGDPGIRETLATMARAVRNAVADVPFVWWARELVADCAPRDEACQATVVRRFVGESVSFVRDPVGVENVTPPLEHMRKLRGHWGAFVAGDCDDAATLSAALGMSLGMPARFVALAFPLRELPAGTQYSDRSAPYQHVFTELLAAGSWRDMDTTRPFQNLPPRVVRRLSFPV